MTLRSLYRYVGSLTRPVRYRSETALNSTLWGRMLRPYSHELHKFATKRSPVNRGSVSVSINALY